ncbi:hypothetical protein POF50_002285 [Streptomyces sp. SL13]|uniref:Uncharacterized protein n=1 Tax=Streptantibioticus silvisoli TaxID=2705255 RepID=A0AA90GUI8_9ACTN|nr:hypothetical protein [Streptantibioticus silvisoli]MDI5968184.1 hypothetical protein [Streptantibioticus silvisoli]
MASTNTDTGPAVPGRLPAAGNRTPDFSGVAGPADGPHLPPAGRPGPGPIAHAARFAGAAAL